MPKNQSLKSWQVFRTAIFTKSLYVKYTKWIVFLANKYLLKVKNKKTKKTLNAFKVNIKETGTISLPFFCCLYCWLWRYFPPFSSVCIVNFEQVNVSCVPGCDKKRRNYKVNCLSTFKFHKMYSWLSKNSCRRMYVYNQDWKKGILGHMFSRECFPLSQSNCTAKFQLTIAFEPSR